MLINIQKAVIAVLRNDAGLAGSLGGRGSSMRLYDSPPDKPVYPFARISNIESRPDDDSGRKGHTVNMGIELADRPADRGEAIDRQKAVSIATSIADLLHRSEVAIRNRLTTDNTWFLVEARYETMSVTPEPDNLTYLAVAGFSFLIDEE